MIRVLFRIAAGPRVGFGHLMRARALAGALGVKFVVSVRGGETAGRVTRELGGTVPADMGHAIAAASVVIVDDPSPAHRRAWLKRAARQGVPSVAIVDAGARERLASLVVDGSVAADVSRTGGLAGSKFFILDAPVVRERSRPRPSRAGCRVLVALGGGSHVLAAAGRLVSAVRRRCPDADVHVAAGFVKGRRPSLDGGTWLVGRRGLAGALSAADVGVLAGGVTLYEACAIGVPSVGLAVVPAQRRTIRRFAEAGAVIDGGGPRLDEATLGRIALGVERLLTDGKARRRTGRQARRLVDGRGAERVARRIHALIRASETMGSRS